MQIPVSPEVVFFIHVPKCAGTSLGACFDNILRPKGQIFWHGSDGDINIMAAEKRFYCSFDQPSILFIGGHFTLNTVKAIIRDANLTSASIYSIIRDPIEQALSYYQWITFNSIKRGRPHPLFRHCSHMRLEEFFSDEAVIQEVANVQTKYILGINVAVRQSYLDIESACRNLFNNYNFHVYDISNAQLLVDAVVDGPFSSFADHNSMMVQSLNVSPIDTKIQILNDDTKALITDIFYCDLFLYKALLSIPAN